MLYLVLILKAGPQWEIVNTNDLEDEIYTTPAIKTGCLYLRTRQTLYCFGKPD